MPTTLTPPSDISLNLALSLIAASVTPVLLLDGNLSIIAASTSFRDAFDIAAEDVPGAWISGLGNGEWRKPELWSSLKAMADQGAPLYLYEMELASSRGPRHLILNAQRLDHRTGADARLLLSIQDVTDALADARQKDDLLRGKAVLIQEMQHRIANSLQIIASVLMQGVREVGSDESRSHLREAHERILSVAAVQRQLTGSELGDVELRGYFTDLCRSIGDSMIHDHHRLKLTAIVDDSIATSGKAVSLGLIVTELVINALKHGFPDNREGQITVDYRAIGEGWVLTVCDDGVGLPTGLNKAKAGLGTGIITALTAQLGAIFETADARPGVRASVTCNPSPITAS